MSFWGFEQEPDEVVFMYANCQVRCLQEAARLEMKKRKYRKNSFKKIKSSKGRSGENVQSAYNKKK
jgi:hypothetical protein